jgi:hypothetical protein
MKARGRGTRCEERGWGDWLTQWRVSLPTTATGDISHCSCRICARSCCVGAQRLAGCLHVSRWRMRPRRLTCAAKRGVCTPRTWRVLSFAPVPSTVQLRHTPRQHTTLPRHKERKQRRVCGTILQGCVGNRRAHNRALVSAAFDCRHSRSTGNNRARTLICESGAAQLGLG